MLTEIGIIVDSGVSQNQYVSCTILCWQASKARMDAASLEYHDWLRGWKSWASNRKRGKLAQFIVELLETQSGAK